MSSKTHKIKILEKYYERVVSGQKKFELRLNDRDYQVNDILHMVVPEAGAFVSATVTYVLNGPAFGIKKGYCVMSIDMIEFGYE